MIILHVVLFTAV